MKKILKLIAGTVFVISFLCMLAVGGESAAQQFVWSFGWMAVCAASGLLWYDLKQEKK